MKKSMVYDLFISYAHLDNQPLSEGQKGWISSFHNSLEVRLGQLLGRKPSIWRDDKLRGNDRFGDEIPSKLRDTKLFLAVISPGYLESEWCLKELREFIKAADSGDGVYIGNKSRIFKVVKTSVPHGEHPDEIEGLLGYEFFFKDEKGLPREFNPERNLPYYEQFLERLEDVARDICQSIKKMEPENKKESYINSQLDKIDFNSYIIDLINDFEGSELHPLYIEPDFFSEREGKVINSFKFVEEWLQHPRRQQLSLLGDYGSGKTSFAKKLAYNMAKAYKAGTGKSRIPFLVDLGECKEAFTLENLLQHQLKHAEVKPADEKKFLSLLANGRVLLIFDAFDEMAAVNRVEDTLSNFKQLNRAVMGDAKVILISRTHYFRDKKEVNRVLKKQGKENMSDPGFFLYREISGKPRYEVVHLKGFSDTHIRQYLEKTMGEEWKTAYRKIKSIYNLPDLSSRPVLLDMIVKTLPRIETKTEKFNAVHLYEAYTQIWFDREGHRLQMIKDVIEKLVEELACRLWDEEKPGIHYSALSGIIKEHLKGKIKTQRDLEAADNEMRTASFLVRDEAGNYSFAHESFQQFFIARKIKIELLKNNFDMLDLRLLSREIVFFFRHLLANDERTFALIVRLLEAKYRRRISENALFILYTVLRMAVTKQQFSLKEDIKFSSQDVEGFKEIVQDHLPQRFNLSGALLSGWSFPYMVFNNADFTEAKMEGSDFSGSTFRNVVFKGVKAHHCNFRHCRFIDCTIKESDFSMSDFMAAEFESCAAIESNDFTGAGFCSSNFNIEVHKNNCYFGAGAPGAETSKLPRLLVDQGHGDIIRTMAISKDGRFMASGSDDKTVKLWDVERGRLINTLAGHSRPVLSVFISPDNRRVVSGSSDRTVKLWDLENGFLISTLKGHNDWVNSVFISPDNRRIVSGSSDQTVKLWDLESGNLINTMAGHHGVVLSVFVTPDNRRIISAGSDGSLKLWDLEKGRFIKTLKEGKHALSSLFVSPDNRVIATGGYHKRIKLWNLKSVKGIETLEGHSDWVRTIFISADNRRLVSGGDDKTVKLWDLKSGSLVKTFAGHDNIVSSVFISPDNRVIVSGSFDETIKVWDIKSGRLVRTLQGRKDSLDNDMTNPANLHRLYYRDRLALYPAADIPGKSAGRQKIRNKEG